MVNENQIVLEQPELGRTVRRMAHEIIEKCGERNALVLIGIRSRGVHLARRLARSIGEIDKSTPPVAVIDVSRFRDDRVHAQAGSGAFEIEAAVDDKTVVLIDDVIYRGRTIRAAMEAVERLGQPKRILVAALIDRGARELPIRADIVGKNIDALEGQRINVRLVEADGVDQVILVDWRS
ncbi:MAG TPA: bifunctional pyr operon transcriptional regulator/uracil phosphoribosyltransferase PyrR [Candidatus Binatia bacterium]|nr:bifunctional pyr operon transcriptional regulator/uracil phosphoribosyltransferase PyrR [Candidatus Binatia bacterium]